MTVKQRLWAVSLLSPTVTMALGVDGGAVFQIAATENLGLTPRAVGIGLSLGILSVPLQLWAARLPLWRARRNLQLYYLFISVMAAAMAALLAVVDEGERLAVLALAITVLAEINVSVLLATTWQPLMAVTLTPHERQGLQSRGNAAAGLIKAGSAFLFGAVGHAARVGFYAVWAAVAAALSLVIGGVPSPARPPPSDDRPSRAAIPAGMRPLYVTVGIVAAGCAWPLFIVFVDQVLWPDINLGLVAAVQVTGSLLAAALWRSTTGDVGPRVRWAAAGSLAAAIAFAVIPGRVDSTVEEAVFFAALAGGAGSASILFLSIMELAHRVIDEHTAVRSMTVYDVVASTSMQAGLLAAGFLISAGSLPYRVYLVVMAAAANASIRGSTG